MSPAEAAAQPDGVETAPAPTAKRQGVLSIIVGARWVLAIPALLLALYAEQMIRQTRALPDRPPVPPDLDWQLFALSGLLLAIAAWPSRPLLPAGPSVFLEALKEMKRRALFLIPLAGSIICAAASIPLFWELNGNSDADSLRKNWLVNTGSWLLYIAALLLLGLAFVIWERRAGRQPAEGVEAGPPGDRLPRHLEWGLMAALLVLALGVRLWNLEGLPPGFWFDEGQNGVVGRQLLAPDALHQAFIGDVTQMGTFYFYFLGIVVKALGNSIGALRFLPALSGALIAPMLYLLAARLYGWRVGLAAAGLVAVSSWNITFSRFGIASMPTVALDVAVFLCMVQALRTGRLGYYAAGGVLLGMALQMYYISRLVPLILVAILLHRLITERMRVLRSLRAGMVVFALGAIIAFLPVGLFALQKPDIYNSRTDTVSIFSPDNNGGDLNAAISKNISVHMLMFDWEGDANGRHNLPHSPMLDWITAALFFGGLASCAFRAWRWQYFFPIVWFAAALSGGVLTLPGEAPQGHRSLEESVVTALLGGIFAGQVLEKVAGADMLGRLARLSAFRRGPRVTTATTTTGLRWPARAAWAVGIAGLLIAVGLAGEMNFNKYFVAQAHDETVWRETGIAALQAARAVAHYGNDRDVYVVPLLRNAPPSKYLAPDIETLSWPGMQAMPLQPGKPGGAVIILDPTAAADVAAIARIYPHAHFEIVVTPASDQPLLYTITIPASDTEQARGVHATQYAPGSTKAQSDETLADFNYDWGRAAVRPSSVRLSSTIKIDKFGAYSFDLQGNSGSAGPGEILLDGYRTTARQPVTLGSGLHSVVVTGTVGTGTGALSLVWSPPSDVPAKELAPVPASILFDPRMVTPHGLTVVFRQGDTFDEPPANGRVDPVVSFYFQETPLQRPYTGEWSGRIYIPRQGSYAFGTQQLSTSQLYIDGKETVSNDKADTYKEQSLPLTAGWHDIRLKYRDAAGYSNVYLYWTPPDRPRSIIPSVFLWPQMGQYPDKPEGRDLPGLDQSDGSQLPGDRVTWFPRKPAGK